MRWWREEKREGKEEKGKRGRKETVIRHKSYPLCSMVCTSLRANSGTLRKKRNFYKSGFFSEIVLFNVKSFIGDK